MRGDPRLTRAISTPYRTKLGDDRGVVRQDHRAARLPLHLLRPLAQVVPLAGGVGAILPVAVKLKRFFAADLFFSLGIS